MRYSYMIDKCDSATGWTVLGNDTTNLAAATACLTNAASLEFDKANGAGNTVFAGAYKTIDRTLRTDQFYPTDKMAMTVYVSAVTNVAYAFVRVGTDSSNYVEYRFADTTLTAGAFTLCTAELGTGYITGTGWLETVIDNDGDVIDLDYLVVGVAFDAEANTLADIKVQDVGILEVLRT